MKNLITLLSFFFLALLVPSLAHAQYVPTQPIAAALFLEKKVLNPQTNTFENDLEAKEFLFLPDKDVVFRVEVKNTTQNTLSNLTLTDKLPSQVQFLSTSAGTYDSASHSIILNIENFAINDSRVLEIRTRVKANDQIAANICPSNFVEAKASGLMEQRTSSFCISKQVLGVVQELPKTGPAANVLVALGSLFSLGLSGYLFKKSKI